MVGAFTWSDVADLALAIFLIVVGVGLGWALLTLSGTLMRLTSFIRGAQDEILPVINKVGGSVDRNKVKRTLREAFWSLSDRLPEKHDFVIVARADIGGLIEKEGTGGVTKSLEEAMDASFGGGRST